MRRRIDPALFCFCREPIGGLGDLKGDSKRGRRGLSQVSSDLIYVLLPSIPAAFLGDYFREIRANTLPCLLPSQLAVLDGSIPLDAFDPLCLWFSLRRDYIRSP
jgi:hypothetical protein